MPTPEQDAPRYEAVVTSRFGKQLLSQDEWPQQRDRIIAEAEDWTALAQLDVREWLQDNAEGQVCDLICGADLGARRFGRVVCVSLQT